MRGRVLGMDSVEITSAVFFSLSWRMTLRLQPLIRRVQTISGLLVPGTGLYRLFYWGWGNGHGLL